MYVIVDERSRASIMAGLAMLESHQKLEGVVPTHVMEHFDGVEPLSVDELRSLRELLAIETPMAWIIWDMSIKKVLGSYLDEETALRVADGSEDFRVVPIVRPRL